MSQAGGVGANVQSPFDIGGGEYGGEFGNFSNIGVVSQAHASGQPIVSQDNMGMFEKPKIFPP